MIKFTYDMIAQAWLMGAPSQLNSMYTIDNDLYSYELVIGRHFKFHGQDQIFLIAKAPTQTTARHLKAAERELSRQMQEFDWHPSIYYVEDVEVANDQWINGMFNWVEKTVNKTSVYSVSSAGLTPLIEQPTITLDKELNDGSKIS